MQSAIDCGLVLQYVKEIQCQAVVANSGINVKPAIEAVVDKACKYFLDADGNVGRIHIRIFKNELVHRTTYLSNPQHEYRKALKYAIALISLNEV